MKLRGTPKVVIQCKMKMAGFSENQILDVCSR
jgi:hypothetical protein